MKKRLNALFKLTIGISCLILMSCNDVDLMNISKDIQIDESLVFPIGEGSITLEEILNQFDFQNHMSIDADTINFVTEHSKEYEFVEVNLLKNAEDKIANLPVPTATILKNSNLPVVGNNEFEISLGLEPNSTTNRFDSVEVSTATFGLTLSVTDIKTVSENLGISPSDLKITIVFPEARYFNSNTPISKELTVNQFGQMTSFDIVNFKAKTIGKLGIPFQIKFKSGDRDIKVGTNGNIHIEAKINQLVCQVAYGKFVLTTTESTNLKIPLDFLSDFPKGLRFANPKALINLESNIGGYYKFTIESLKAYSKDGSTMKQAMFNGNTTDFEIVDIKPATPGLFITKYLKPLNRIYGEIDHLFDTSIQLDTLEYKFSVQTEDALNNSSPTPSFIISGMKLKANVKIQVPLYLKEGSNSSISDTLKNIDIKLIENIEKAILVLKVTNGLPVKVTYSMKFLNATNTVITSSINDLVYVVNSGNVDVNGLITSPTITPINIELTKEQAMQLKDAKSMIYTVKIDGQDATKQIHFTKNNYIKVNLGAFINGSYKTTLGTNN